MKEEGIVIKKEGKYVYVKTIRSGACGGNCAECGGCGGAKEQVVKAVNCENLEKGDAAELELNSKNVLKAAFMVYILPLVLFTAGFCIAQNFIKNNIICICAGIIFMIIGFFFIKIYDKKSSERYLPKAFLHVEENKE